MFQIFNLIRITVLKETSFTLWEMSKRSLKQRARFSVKNVVVVVISHSDLFFKLWAQFDHGGGTQNQNKIKSVFTQTFKIIT